MFIAFEGLDGSGSSTQSEILFQKMKEKGVNTIKTKEPTSNHVIGKMIRDILQHKWHCSPEGLQLLFSADRAEHLKNEIEPALKANQTIISDRYFFSTIAYGSLAIKDWDWLKALNQHFRVPDLTFLLQLSPEKCIERIQSRGQEVELFETTEKLEKIWKGYSTLSEEYENIHLIDADRSIEEISNEIWNVYQKHL